VVVRKQWCESSGAKAVVRKQWCESSGAKAVVRKQWCGVACARALRPGPPVCRVRKAMHGALESLRVCWG
jgi:hypothetical protein